MALDLIISPLFLDLQLAESKAVGFLGLHNPEIINSVQVGVPTSAGSRWEVWVVQVKMSLLGSVQVERGVERFKGSGTSRW